MAEREIIETLKKFIALLKSEGIPVDKAFLYGSFASGTANKDSDIDLLIVTKKSNSDIQAGKIWSLTRFINSRIEPYIIDADRFYSDDNSPMIETVKKTGVEII